VRLLDEDSDRTLTSLALYLTPKEAQRVQKELDRLIQAAEKGRLDHVHVDDREYDHHLTLVLYTPERADEFQPRWKRLILEDR
jgi:hypothetical protein